MANRKLLFPDFYSGFRVDNLPNRILAKVKFNTSVAVVLDVLPKLKYKKLNGIIYGTDGLFYDCYYYDHPSFGFEAFGGRKFNIRLEDGEVIHCTGQWWDGGYSRVSKLIGSEFCSVTASTLAKLKSYYVFSGYHADKKKWLKFVHSYDLPIYEYWDYEKIINYDDMRSNLLKRICKLEKTKRSLIKVVKDKHRQIEKPIEAI